MIFKTKKNKIKKKYFNLFNSLKNIFAFIFSIQIILIFFLLIWYSTSPVKSIHSPKKIFNIIGQKTKNVIGFDINVADEYLKVYFLSAYYSIFKPNIDKIDLNINQTNILELEFQRQNRDKIVGTDIEMKKRLSKFVNGSLNFNKKKIPIKLRVKGDRAIHYDKVLTTSYKIDLRKGKKIWGLEEFSIQKPIVRNYAYEFIFHKLQHEMGNISLNYKLVNLSINGLNYGLYSIEEGFTKELLERHAKRNGPIYGIRDDISGPYPNIIYDSYSELSWVANNQELLRSGYGILNLIKENDEKFNDFIDWEAWAKFFAVADMVEAYHGALAKSVRVYYNPVSGKIEPISFDGHHGTADFSDFIILDFLKENSSCSWICGEKIWFERFLLDKNNNPREEFIKPYLKFLKQLSSEKFIKSFNKKYSSEINNLNKLFYSDFSLHDNVLWKGIFPYIYNKKYLQNRAKKINQKLNDINFSNFLFSKKEDSLEIKFAQGSVPIKIISDCDLDEYNFEIWINKSKKINWPKNCKTLNIQSINQLSHKVFLFDNPVLDKFLPTNFNNFPSITDIVKGDIVNNNFRPLEKEILINKSVKLPKNINLELNDDQKIIIKNGSTLALFGNLFINSKGNNEGVIIEGLAPSFGSIISFNNIFTAENLKIKNLTAPKTKGYIYYAGINIINSKVKLNNVTFMNSLSEDALNLINSESTISNIKFKNSKSDALDIDSGYSEIYNVQCEDIGNDCLDFSNAEIKIENLFARNIYDKSISVGENSKVKIKNVDIDNSEIGLAVKDNSDAEINYLQIKNSTLPIAVFVKKNEYGPAKLNIKNFKLEKSNNIFLVDNKSHLVVDGVKYLGTKSGEEIESYLYGNLYGRETIR